MKLVKCELQTIAWAALLAGVFSMNPMAMADATLSATPNTPAAATIAPGTVLAQPTVSAPAPAAPAPVAAAAPAIPAPAALAPALAAPVAAVAEQSRLPSSAATTADDSPPDEESGGKAADQVGLSFAQLKKLGVSIEIDKVNKLLRFHGRLPKACSDSMAQSDREQPSFEGNSGKNVLIIDMPACRKGKPKGETVQAASVLDPIPLANAVDGSFVLRFFKDGDDTDPTDEALTDKSGKALAFVTDAKLKAEADKKEKADQDAAIVRNTKFLTDKIDVDCKNGDLSDIDLQLRALEKVVGSVAGIRAKLDEVKQKYFLDLIGKSKDADAARAAYDSYMDAASGKGWDEDKASAAYGEKRIDIMNTVVAESKGSADKKAKLIKDTEIELRSIGQFNEKIGSGERTGSQLVGAAYFSLGNQVAADAGTDISKLGDAETYYREAGDYGDYSSKVKVEEEIAKMYNNATEQCLSEAKEKGKGFEKCDKLAKKTKGAMDKAMAAQLHLKGDDSLEALAGMKNEKIGRFGIDGYTVNYSGYGAYNLAGGSYDKEKKADYMQAQQTFMMQMYMKQMGGGAGMTAGGVQGNGQMAGSANGMITGGGSFFQ